MSKQFNHDTENTGKLSVGKTVSGTTKDVDVNGDINIDNDFYKEGFLFIHTNHDSSPFNLNGNTFIGFGSGIATTIGGNNNAVGRLSMNKNTTGQGNVAFGTNSLFNLISGNTNSAFGCDSLKDTTGTDNVGVGDASGKFFTSGLRNTAIGSQAFGSVTNSAITGSDNVGVGQRAGAFFTGNSNRNISIGSYGGLKVAGTFNDSCGIGYSNQVSASNQMVIGSGGSANTYTDIIIGSLTPAVNQHSTVNFNIRAGRSGHNLDNTNLIANSLTLAGGESSGDGAGGNLIFQTTESGVSGTVFNSLATRLTIEGDTGKATFTGDVESSLDGAGFIVTSPDGLIQRRIGIDNSGTFTVSTL